MINKFWFLLLALIMAPSPAIPQSFHLEDLEFSPYIVMRCIPPTGDDQIDISMVLLPGDDWILKDLTVVHNTPEGTFNRANQYFQGDLWKTPKLAEFFWSGIYKKDPSVMMIGKVWHAAGSWRYEEYQTKSNVPQFDQVSRCPIHLP